MYYKLVYNSVNNCYWIVYSENPSDNELVMDTDIPPINDRETAKILVEALNDYYEKCAQ